MHVSDSEHVESSRRPVPPEVVQPATYNYRSLDHQAGPSGGQSGVSVRGGNALLRQENSGTTTAKGRAGKFGEKAKKKASSLTPGEVAAKKEALARREKEKQVVVLEKRIQDRLSRRVDQLPSPENAHIPRDKLDGYALNSVHEEGRTKAAGFAKAGFPLVNAWENKNPEIHRAAADADP